MKAPLPGDLMQDFPPGVGNLTVKSLTLPRGSIEMYTGFDTVALPLSVTGIDIGPCLFPLCFPVGGGWDNTLIGALFIP